MPCDYTPKANATMATVKVRSIQITLTGLPDGRLARGSGYRGGITEFKFIPGALRSRGSCWPEGRPISHYKLADANAKTATLVEDVRQYSRDQSVDRTYGLVSMAFNPGLRHDKFIFLGVYEAGLTATKLSSALPSPRDRVR